MKSGERRVTRGEWRVESGEWRAKLVIHHSPIPDPLSPLLALATCLLILAGCSWSPTPEFKLNTEGRAPQSIGQSQREAIIGILKKLFGTPDKPLLPDGIALDMNLLAVAAGPVGTDENENPRGLFRKHCSACHGITGDGTGPNAAALMPYPRDYRQGLFKFTSTAGGSKPVRDDLLRTLQNGIPGTAMPSFGKLPANQLESLIEYVKYLSIRGETELFLIGRIIDEDETIEPENVATIIDEGAKPIADAWQSAVALRVNPSSPPPTDTAKRLAASLARGKKIFLSTDAQCFKCHGTLGDGNGERSPLYDEWNKPKQAATPQEIRRIAPRFSLPLTEIKPRNFTEGIFHGGNRPIDQYYRVAVGIKGTPMPPAGPAPGSIGILPPGDIWHVVNYVRSLGKHPTAK